MNQIKQVSRLDWIDVAKGYGILLVIWAHMPDEGLRAWMYSFHIPLFFFLSGYVFSTKHKFSVFLKRKIKAMIIPYICLGIPLLIFDAIWRYLDGVFVWVRIRWFFEMLIRQQRFHALWYVACLFWLNIIFYGLVKLIKNEWVLGIFSIMSAAAGVFYYNNGGQPLFWNVDTCLTAMPFFFMGYYYKMHHERINRVFEYKWSKVFLFLAFGVINIYCNYKSWEISGCGLEMFFSWYGSPVYTYLSAFAGIVCMVILARQWTIKPLRYIGENSMLYYACHQLIAMEIVERAFADMGYFAEGSTGHLVIYKLVSLIIILIMITIGNEIIKKCRLGFMIGK